MRNKVNCKHTDEGKRNCHNNNEGVNKRLKLACHYYEYKECRHDDDCTKLNDCFHHVCIVTGECYKDIFILRNVVANQLVDFLLDNVQRLSACRLSRNVCNTGLGFAEDCNRGFVLLIVGKAAQRNLLPLAVNNCNLVKVCKLCLVTLTHAHKNVYVVSVLGVAACGSSVDCGCNFTSNSVNIQTKLVHAVAVNDDFRLWKTVFYIACNFRNIILCLFL